MTKHGVGPLSSTVTQKDSRLPEDERSAGKRAGDPTEEVQEDREGVVDDVVAGPPSAGDASDDIGKAGEETRTDAQTPRRRSISINVRSLLIAVVIAILAGAAGTLGWLYIAAQAKLESQATAAAKDARAEKVGLEYAVNAAAMDHKDLQAWKVRLVAGTTPELDDKLTKAAESMEQILVPLEWSSTAEPLAAKVRSITEGLYVVDCFVSVRTKTVQAPEALQSTATYSVTVDSNKDWQIADVGGVGSVLSSK